MFVFSTFVRSGLLSIGGFPSSGMRVMSFSTVLEKNTIKGNIFPIYKFEKYSDKCKILKNSEFMIGSKRLVSFVDLHLQLAGQKQIFVCLYLILIGSRILI
jgi:hypothetical protein